jgi:hypothetical protein
MRIRYQDLEIDNRNVSYYAAEIVTQGYYSV